ncbi:RDD family protein [Rickettsia endosymbiont of Halotydeus destructor]|uniref:RDD family protein n=1 Tax=Rickettsia endosymbiont of Halotydeus destructor TaxID=2996754 RepID=UPI003BB12CC6
MSDYTYCGAWRRFGAYLCDSNNLYWSLFESSKMHATPGKYLLNIKITNKNGTKINFLKSFSRLLLYLIIIIFGFGIAGIINLLCIIFTKEKTSIPDMICGTRVVRR